MPMVAQQAEMEDIISSIRSTLAEEKARVAGGAPSLPLDADDDILELTPAEMVASNGTNGNGAHADEELVDIAAFALSGEAKPIDASAAMAKAGADLLGETPAAPVVPPATPAPAVEVAPAPEIPAAAPAAPAETSKAADEFDMLLATISAEQQQKAVAAEEHKKALLEEEEPLADIPAVAPVALEAAFSVEDGVEAAGPKTSAEPASFVEVEALEGDNGGLQLAFPAEVLAMALRPMVQDWLKANLPAIVERLVKDEISKMTQN